MILAMAPGCSAGRAPGRLQARAPGPCGGERLPTRTVGTGSGLDSVSRSGFKLSSVLPALPGPASQSSASLPVWKVQAPWLFQVAN
jgi:hypothetical protein